MEALLTELEAAQFLQIQDTLLETLRNAGAGPDYIRVSPRVIRYRSADLERWIAARAVTLTKPALVAQPSA